MKSTIFTKNFVLRILVLLLISIIVGFGVYSWNAKSLTGNALPMPLGFGVAVVLSGSMEPSLSVDDVIIVRPTGDYEVGDVVVFQNGRSLTVHEIISIDGELVTTKGSANNTPDEPIQYDYIKGEVVAVIPAVGVIVSIAKSPLVTVLLLAVAVLLLILSYRKEREEDDKELDSIKEEIRKLKEQKKD